jgi:CheY-like chemotaxis protein
VLFNITDSGNAPKVSFSPCRTQLANDREIGKIAAEISLPRERSLASGAVTRYKRWSAGIHVNERKVLVVDDDPGMREVLESILVLENTLVYTAVDGKDAVQKTLTLKPDLILLDVNMPKLNGLTFCRAIRAGKETRNIPVIIITSLTAEGRLEECMEAGADDFLGKPFAMEELLIRVRAMFKTAHVPDHVERLNQYILAVRDIREHTSGDLKPQC